MLVSRDSPNCKDQVLISADYETKLKKPGEWNTMSSGEKKTSNTSFGRFFLFNITAMLLRET